MDFDREAIVYSARLSKLTKSHEDVVKHITTIIKKTGELRSLEWILLCDAYNSMIQPLRDSWKTLSFKLENESNQKNKDRIRDYQKTIEDEITDVFVKVMFTLDQPIKPEDNPTNAAFSNKMRGKHYMYLAEITSGDERKEHSDKSFKAYQSAMATATESFPPANYLRLSVALEFSVFHHEILGSHARACEIAEKAIEEAEKAIEEASPFGGDMGESTMIMQSLKEHLEHWKAKKEIYGTQERWIYCRIYEKLIDWSCRRNIIIDIAKGLAYLHEDCLQKIIHLDISLKTYL